jgi:hypothetical protein
MDSFVAEFQIARILNTKLIDLDELLSELDIAEVSWIAKPTFDFDTPDSSLVSGLDDDSDGETGVVSCDDT